MTPSKQAIFLGLELKYFNFAIFSFYIRTMFHIVVYRGKISESFKDLSCNYLVLCNLTIVSLREFATSKFNINVNKHYSHTSSAVTISCLLKIDLYPKNPWVSLSVMKLESFFFANIRYKCVWAFINAVRCFAPHYLRS